ncbi:MAG: adenylyl-sulfate kinase [Mycobacteriales bacterium]
MAAADPPLPAAQARPVWAPDDRERADLELLLNGGYPALPGFLGRADVDSVHGHSRLANGTHWPVAVTLEVPDELAARGALTLTDPEGAPIATIEVSETWPGGPGRHFVAGPVARLAPTSYGTFGRLHLTPEQVRTALAGAPALAVIAEDALHYADLAAIRSAAAELRARVLLLVPTAEPGSEGLVRMTLAAADEIADALLVAVPLPRPDGSVAELLRAAHVATAFGATHLLSRAAVPDPPLTVVRPARTDGPDLPAPSRDDLDALLDAGAALPAGFTPAAVETELRRGRRPLRERGLVVLFTGLSGSGKSTLARGLHDVLLERGDRTVSLLDGDVVRRMLSAGLGFSRADRDLNVARIGYVAAGVARHGGVAICAPIAPYDATRAQVRAMAEAVGDFVLIWVATPLEQCEKRDRKGLYAQARAGRITGFTGIDDPYEDPADADLVLDTTGRDVQDCLAEVVRLLETGGWMEES